VVARYQKRISGPLLDRIDIHVDVPRVNYEKLSGQRLGEPSHAVRERVAAARQLQAKRFKGTRMLTNADMGPAEVREHCRLDEAGQRLMQAAMRQLHLSAPPTIACSSWPAPSPTWRVWQISGRLILRRRSVSAQTGGVTATTDSL
jgi:predicted ATPase with chaperone activity